MTKRRKEFFQLWAFFLLLHLIALPFMADTWGERAFVLIMCGGFWALIAEKLTEPSRF